MKLLRIFFMFGVLGTTSATAAAAAFSNVRDDSCTEPNGSRVLKLSITIDAPVGGRTLRSAQTVQKMISFRLKAHHWKV
jgi:hypothetical protein